MKKIAVILFGGAGKRLNPLIAKQFIDLNNFPLCYYTISVFNSCQNIDEIALVIRAEDSRFYGSIIKKYSFNKVKYLITGGETRFQSSFKALEYLENKVASDDIILIHDGARIFITEEIINENINTVDSEHGVITGVKSTDTILSNMEYLNRDYIYQVQTPQTFIFSDIFSAYQTAIAKKQFHFTDDGQVFTLIGKDLKIVSGSNRNIKITTEFDLELAKLYLIKN